MTLARKLTLGALGAGLAVLATAWWLLGTESGLRFIIAQAESRFPAGLDMREPGGSILRGVCFRSVDWQSESLDVAITDACVDVELAKLMSRQLVIRSLDVDRISIDAAAATAAESSGELPDVESPLAVSVAASSIRNLSFRQSGLERRLDEIRFRGALQESRLEVAELTVRSDWLSADLDGDVELAGRYPARLNLSWRWSELPAMQLAGELALDGDLQRYDIHHTLSAPQQLATTGFVSYSGNRLALDLTNTWNEIEWPLGDSLLKSSQGSLHLRGGPESFDLELDGFGQLDELPATAVFLQGQADLRSLHASDLRMSNEFGELAASGDLRWGPESSFEMAFKLANLDPSRASQLLEGRVAASGRVTGAPGTDGFDVRILVDGLGGTVNGYPLNSDGTVEYAAGRVSFSDTRIRLGASRIGVRGFAGDALSLDLDLDVPALGELLPGAAGRVAGTLSLRGSRNQPGFNLRANGTDVAWTDYAVDDMAVVVNVTPSRSVAADIGLQGLTIRGDEFDSALIGIKGTLDQHAIHAQLGGKANRVNLAANGGYSAGRWDGTLNALAVDSELAGSWSSSDPARVMVASDAASISRICVVRAAEATRACIEASASRGAATLFNLEISALPLGLLPLELPRDVSISGLADAEARGSYLEGRLNGNASVILREAHFDAAIDGENISVVVTDAGWRGTITDNRLTSSLQINLDDGVGVTKVDLAVDDIFDRGSAIGGRGHIDINDLSLFAIFVPDVANPRGVIRGNMDIAGTLGQPEFLGAIQVSDGSFRVRQAGIDIRDFNARLSQTAPGRLHLDGTATSGDGRMTIVGDTWVGAETGFRSELLLNGENFELARLPDWQLVASPSIAVVFDDRAATVTGSLLIPTAEIRMQELPEYATSPSPDAVVHEQQGIETSVRRRINVDVAVALGKDVRFSGFGLTTGIDGVVRLRGGTHSPYTGSGRLSLREGRYKAYGQDLEIQRGQLIFNGPLDNPQLDVRAVRRTADVVAGIELTGTPVQLRSRVFSEPPLRDAEALSYILTGRPMASATSRGEGDMLGAAAFALGISGAGNIVSQVRSELGLETLTVEGGADDGRLIAGKRFGERLVIEYGYGLIDKLGSLLLRYQLSERITLESRTGTVSNLDILYSVKKK